MSEGSFSKFLPFDSDLYIYLNKICKLAVKKVAYTPPPKTTFNTSMQQASSYTPLYVGNSEVGWVKISFFLCLLKNRLSAPVKRYCWIPNIYIWKNKKITIFIYIFSPKSHVRKHRIALVCYPDASQWFPLTFILLLAPIAMSFWHFIWENSIKHINRWNHSLSTMDLLAGKEEPSFSIEMSLFHGSLIISTTFLNLHVIWGFHWY